MSKPQQQSTQKPQSAAANSTIAPSKDSAKPEPYKRLDLSQDDPIMQAFHARQFVGENSQAQVTEPIARKTGVQLVRPIKHKLLDFEQQDLLPKAPKSQTTMTTTTPPTTATTATVATKDTQE